MNDYDIYLRDSAVHGGDWVGFALAWKGLGGVAGLATRPHAGWWPWLADPVNPDDPTAGSRGVRQWRLELALVDGLVGLRGVPSDDGRTPTAMRADLMSYKALTKLELQDVDGVAYNVMITAYTEHVVEPYDAAHPDGGWVVRIEFAEVKI
jgi:hypothetical protein